MLLFLLSFFAGILTVLAPCVLPILPIILAGSVGEKSWKRPLLVTLSLAFSIVFFTVFLKATTLFIDIPFSFWKTLSGGLLIILGGIYVFPHIWAQISSKLGAGNTQVLLGKTQNIGSSNLQAIATGAALGPVFSSCSPTYAFLLATVFPANFLYGVIYTFSYALGLCSILFLIAWGGQKFVRRLRFFADEKGIFKKVLGVIFILIGLAIFVGVDKKIETRVLDIYNPSGIEESLFKSFFPEPSFQKNEKSMKIIPFLDTIKMNVSPPYLAPEIYLTNWIPNTPYTMQGLQGKVVLIDFWTFGCINCKHTRPYLNEWYEKYKDQGLEILGVHAPEFAYEKDKNNLQAAIQKEDIKYPVVMDNDFELWKAYNNHYWPALYFIDKNGYVRHHHFGEGDYKHSEEVIKTLLKEAF